MSSKKSVKTKPPAEANPAERQVEVLQILLQQESHSGPMPAPALLAQYELALPGTAEIIRAEFQTNGEHTRKMELLIAQMHKDEWDKNRRAAQQLAWGALLASVGLAALGHDVVAAAIATTTVGALVAAFLYDRKTEAVKDKENPPD